MEKNFAVIKFDSDGMYSVCSQKHKVASITSLFVVGEKTAIQWGRSTEWGIVDFADGKLVHADIAAIMIFMQFENTCGAYITEP